MAPDADTETRAFLHRLADILIEFLRKSYDRQTRILDFHHPEQLLEVLDLTLPAQPQNLNQLLADCRDTLTYQVKVGQCFKLFLLK